jgi:hypothetical protein
MKIRANRTKLILSIIIIIGLLSGCEINNEHKGYNEGFEYPTVNVGKLVKITFVNESGIFGGKTFTIVSTDKGYNLKLKQVPAITENDLLYKVGPVPLFGYYLYVNNPVDGVHYSIYE